MKKWLLFLLMVGFNYSLPAVNSDQLFERKQFNELTVGQFILMDLDKLQKNKVIRLNWLQKTLIKSAQCKMRRKVANGKIEADKKLFDSENDSGNNNRGLVSILFAIGVAFLFIWPSTLLLLGMPMSIIGLIFGIKGLKKDNSKSLSILGIIFNSIAILFFLTAIIAVGFGSFNFGSFNLHF